MNKETSSSSKVQGTNQAQETFKFDKAFWNKITPEHREGIRTKYGISGDLPTPNKLYHPISHSERPSIRDQLNAPRVSTFNRKPDSGKENLIATKNRKIGERNEIRNI